MHTIKVIAAGLLLLAICFMLTRGLVGPAGPWVGRACKVFIPLWLIAAAVNMWIGVSRAGYSVAQEAPIFVAVFAVPTAVAVLVWWRWAS